MTVVRVSLLVFALAFSADARATTSFYWSSTVTCQKIDPPVWTGLDTKAEADMSTAATKAISPRAWQIDNSILNGSAFWQIPVGWVLKFLGVCA